MSISHQSDYFNSQLIAPLAHFDRGSIAHAGGKGANLAELIRAGFQVPPGFVLTTSAYDLLIQTTGPQAQNTDRRLRVAGCRKASSAPLLVSQSIRLPFSVLGGAM